MKRLTRLIVCNKSMEGGLQLYVRAASFAADKHKFQKRKAVSAIPYINHPLQVAAILVQCGITDPITLSAAVLHDTVQDTNTSYQELTKQFGQEVSDIVKECSDDKKLQKVERKKAQIEHAKHASPKAKLVKLADKISNNAALASEPPKGWSPLQVRGYAAWSYEVYQSLKGLNQALDLKLEHILKQHNVLDLSQQDRSALMHDYYEILQKSNDKS